MRTQRARLQRRVRVNPTIHWYTNFLRGLRKENRDANTQTGLDHPVASDPSTSTTSTVSVTAFNSIQINMEAYDFLRTWIVQNRLTCTAVNQLLKFVRGQGVECPKDYRTLMCTPRQVPLRFIDPGVYGHYGIQKAISRLSLTEELTNAAFLSIQIFVDGIKPFLSSGVTLWPVLARIVVPVVTQPFLVGLYGGGRKPRDVNTYLANTVNELQQLQSSGVRAPGAVSPVRFELQCVVSDSQARAFVKIKKETCGYKSCDKCTQHGVRRGRRMTYVRRNARPWTNETFRCQPGRKPSIFEQIRIDMIEDFPLDYMHLVCLGVCKRLIEFWHEGYSKVRLNLVERDAVDERLLTVGQQVRGLFPRLCRGSGEYRRWKAAEFRQFLLYLGPVVLKNILLGEQYDNFLDLFMAVRIFCDPTSTTAMLQFGKSAMDRFVDQFGKIYGRKHVVYNVYSCSHLHEDRKLGQLLRISFRIVHVHIEANAAWVQRPSQSDTATL